MTPEQKIKAVKDLLESDGWRLLQETLESELVTASLALATNARLSHDEIQYQRGAIWAASKLPTIPHRMLVTLENEVLMRKIDESKVSNG